MKSRNKSFQKLEGKEVITDPKTEKSNRTIVMPDFLCIEMKEYLKSLYGYKKQDRIFQISKSYVHHEMDRGAKAAGIKRINSFLDEPDQAKFIHRDVECLESKYAVEISNLTFGYDNNNLIFDSFNCNIE